VRIALGVLVAAAGLAFIAKLGPSRERAPEPRDRGNQHAGPPEHGSEPPGGSQPLRFPSRANTDQHADAGDERHKRGERVYWWVTGTTSVSATIAAAAAAWFANGAFTETRRQADTAQQALVAADRPWIKVVDFTAHGIKVEEKVVWAHATIQVKNIGRSPAQHTFVRVKLIPDPSMLEEPDEAVRLCREAEDEPRWWANRLIFPDDTAAFREAAASEMRDVLDQRDAKLRWEREQIAGITGDGPVARAIREVAEEGLRAKESQPLYAGFALVGCITYAIPNGQAGRGAIGQTTFTYGLDHACGLGPIGACAFPMAETGVYAGEQVRVREAVSPTFAR